ncbi:MAG: competence/damage-inducible protein A [Deltaproteobacteria bacterium]|nr:competence/damage-inducible protein A [Deltaproteobacteria bacterium]
MKIEIIAIGNEVLCGDVINSNAAWLSAELYQRGFEVVRHTTVADDETEIALALQAASQKVQVVLITGGLGPTVDDFTLEVAAKFFGLSMKMNAEVIAQLHQFYTVRGRAMTPNQEKQAFIPEGAEAFLNPVGSAPGVRVQFQQTQFFFMPGVPKEMKEISKGFVFPFLEQHNSPQRFFAFQMLRCFGAEEAKLDHLLSPLLKDRVDLFGSQIAFRVSLPDVFIKLSAWDVSQEAAQQKIASAEALVREKVGAFIYGEKDQTLEECVGNLLKEKQKTLAVAESCTGGHLANRLSNIPGSSQYFLGGAVVYSNELKKKILGVSEKTLKNFGAVSEECVREMALGLQKLTGADFCLSITGIAGPEGESAEKPVGTVFIALAQKDKDLEVKQFLYPTNREWFKLIVSSVALNWIRKLLFVDLIGEG